MAKFTMPLQSLRSVCVEPETRRLAGTGKSTDAPLAFCALRWHAQKAFDHVCQSLGQLVKADDGVGFAQVLLHHGDAAMDGDVTDDRQSRHGGVFGMVGQVLHGQLGQQ